MRVGMLLMKLICLTVKNLCLLTKIVYKLAKNIIVVSNRCKQFMVEVEKVNEHKIQVIFLAYNFKLYQDPNELVVAEIKQKYPAKLLLMVACRLVAPKRTELAIKVTRKLVERGIDVKTIILGTGPDFENIKNYIVKNSLHESVFMEGFKLNIMDYLSASDILVHPSLSDSSSVIIKEAGLQKKTVIACEGIGDVDDYLSTGQNAILVSKENTEEEMLNAIIDLYNDKSIGKRLGDNLYNSIIERFSISSILPVYDRIHSTIK